MRDRRRLLRPLAVAAAIAAITVPILEIVAPAGAQSPVNRAPREARRARTVRFVSVVEASLNGRPYTRISERGAWTSVMIDSPHRCRSRDQQAVSSSGKYGTSST